MRIDRYWVVKHPKEVAYEMKSPALRVLYEFTGREILWGGSTLLISRKMPVKYMCDQCVEKEPAPGILGVSPTNIVFDEYAKF